MPTTLLMDAPAEALLTRMRLPKQVIWDLAVKVGGERANVAIHEPPQVVGFETWRWGTRYSREDTTLTELGWALCDKDQVAGIRHAELKIKLVVCGTDKNTGTPKSPKNLSEKGPANCKLIERNSGQLKLKLIVAEEKEPAPDDLWYLCLHYGHDFIAIEVSRPDAEVGGIISHFSDRIIVAKPGDLPATRKIDVPEDFAEVPKPQVTRISE